MFKRRTLKYAMHKAKFLNFLHKTEEQACIDKSITLYRYRSIGIIQKTKIKLPIVVVAVPDVENPTRLTEKNRKPKKTPEKYLQIIIIKLFIVFNFFLDLNIAYISKYIYNI